MGIKGAPEKIGNDQLNRLFRSDSAAKSDLARIGIETPEELAAMFVMDGDEIDRIASDTKPLTDIYPRRLGDRTDVDPAIHEYASHYMQSTAAAERFQSSRLLKEILPDAQVTGLEAFFVIREMRFRSRFEDRNWLADLDIHLRGSNLREPVLETLKTNSFRVALAEKVADSLNPLPAETVPDLIAAALADRNYNRAIQLLDAKRAAENASQDDLLLLTYLYCVNHDMAKAESIAATIQGRDQPITKWLFGKLQAEYGFRPPG